jgi:hypothetical protein
MQLRKAILSLCLLAGAVRSGTPAPQGQVLDVLDRQQPGTKSSALMLNADGADPLKDPLEAQREEEQDFARRLNVLMGALREFSATYNSGHVIDVRKVRAVRKAWTELEKSGWFRAENSK